MKFLHFKIPADLLAAVDDYRFTNRMPSRAAAIIALLKHGLGIGTSAQYNPQGDIPYLTATEFSAKALGKRP
jgi:hypothetical protein